MADAQRGHSGAGASRIALVSPTALEADLVATGAYPAVTTYAQASAVTSADPLVVMRLSGAQLKTVLEQQWQRDAGGAVPARPFLRLGASAGFTWTEDATRPEGDRITGMWLDRTPVLLTGNYPVTVSKSLATGGDNFHELTSGLAPRDLDLSTVSALAAYLSDTAAGGPITPEPSQRAVRVHVPGGAPASYGAGTVYAVDLSSWSYSRSSDPKDATVDVTVGGRPVGSFAVDNTLVDDAFDGHGRVAVRATLPVDLAAGPTTVRIVGTTTGTTVELPITVTAAPAPPAPTPPVPPVPPVPSRRFPRPPRRPRRRPWRRWSPRSR